MFDKSALNNQITANKNCIKKAKISVINKLVKKCRKLEKLAKKSSNENVKHKIDRLTLQISSVKKLNCLETLKKAILYNKDPKTIITNGKASVEDVAQMLVFSNKIVREIVDRLKITFCLDQDNSNWRDIFQKTKKGNKGKKSISKKIASTENKIEIDHDENIISKDIIPAESENDTNNFESQKTKKLISQNNNQNTFREQSNDIKKKFISKADPFFTTGSGQSYMSTSYVENDDVDKDSVGNSNQDKYRIDSRNSTLKNGVYQEKSDANFRNRYQNVFRKSDSILHNLSQTKEKSAIQVFKGKKTRFDDTENVDELQTVKTDNEKLSNSNSFGNAKNSSISDLHPSWQAKQKIKPIIQEFKGQKITFDD